MAESIFQNKVKKAGLSESFIVESAGTGNWHVGDYPDPRTIQVLRKNGITELSHARQFKSSDFEEFDHIVAMDLTNVRDLQEWQGAEPEKVSLMLAWNPGSTQIEVPDPYYGDYLGFEEVFEMLDKATESMLTMLKSVK
jgi:protein-tyrosine phosphatase